MRRLYRSRKTQGSSTREPASTWSIRPERSRLHTRLQRRIRIRQVRGRPVHHRTQPDAFGTTAADRPVRRQTVAVRGDEPGLHLLRHRQYDIDLNTNDVYVDRTTRSSSTARAPRKNRAPHSPAFGSRNRELVAGDRGHQRQQSLRLEGPRHDPPLRPRGHHPRHPHPAPDIDDVGHTTATVKGSVDRAGGTKIVNCVFKYGLTSSYSGGGSGSTPCTARGPPLEAANTQVEAELTGLTTGSTYHFRPLRRQRKRRKLRHRPHGGPGLRAQAADAAGGRNQHRRSRAQRLLRPGRQIDRLLFEYGINDSYGLKTSVTTGGSGTGVTTVGKDDRPAQREDLPLPDRRPQRRRHHLSAPTAPSAPARRPTSPASRATEIRRNLGDAEGRDRPGRLRNELQVRIRDHAPNTASRSPPR